MNDNQAIKIIKEVSCREGCKPSICNDSCLHGEGECAFGRAVKALEEIQEYRKLGTPEELQKIQKEEDILKFYYCDTEDSYLLGQRVGNFYYAHYRKGSWLFDMSRDLPWGKHVVNERSLWKEHTYPSEPREIDFEEWLDGFIKKVCGGTPEECLAAVEKQTAKLVIDNTPTEDSVWYQCPTCKGDLTTIRGFYCQYCGQKLHWR